MQGRKATLKLIRNANINPKDNCQQTPLHYAARWGIPEVVQLLLNGGAEISSKDIKQYTPLDCSIIGERSEEIINLLLESGACSTRCIDYTGTNNWLSWYDFAFDWGIGLYGGLGGDDRQDLEEEDEDKEDDEDDESEEKF